MRILICGGRDYDDWATFTKTLQEHVKPGDLLISGGAEGADTFAERYASNNGYDMIIYPANWTGRGRSAGPFRNQLMLTHAKPELVIAFPGGAGTANMIRLASTAGVKVVKVSPAPTVED